MCDDNVKCAKTNHSKNRKGLKRLDAVAHVCNPSVLGGWGGWITWGQEFKTTLANMVKPHFTKNTKISRVWWWVPVVPATQEAEAGELPEPRRRRLRWAEIAPLHSRLGNKSETPSQKKKEKRKTQATLLILIFFLCRIFWFSEQLVLWLDLGIFISLHL